MNALTEVTELKDAWTRLLPNEPVPADDQWCLWLALHGQGVIQTAITQLALKYRKLGGAMDRDYVVRFISSVMNRLSREGHGTVT